uniref:Major facilitator superfamily (MFS) profile domain-containing protein n=1 Tax=Panagrolaimus sp. ES5 TaxID=591445 RepID=A0AC34G5K7_9BILA
MIALNFTFICMVHKHPTDPTTIATFDNITLVHYPEKPQYFYNQHEKSMLIWAVAISSLIATFPFTILYSKFGAKYVLLSAGLLSAFATLLIPIAVKQGLQWFLILRVFQGISYAAVFAAIGVLCSRWASLKQNGVFISVLTCFSSLASSITNPVAGAVSVFLN